MKYYEILKEILTSQGTAHPGNRAGKGSSIISRGLKSSPCVLLVSSWKKKWCSVQFTKGGHHVTPDMDILPLQACVYGILCVAQLSGWYRVKTNVEFFLKKSSCGFFLPILILFDEKEIAFEISFKDDYFSEILKGGALDALSLILHLSLQQSVVCLTSHPPLNSQRSSSGGYRKCYPPAA